MVSKAVHLYELPHWRILPSWPSHGSYFHLQGVHHRGAWVEVDVPPDFEFSCPQYRLQKHCEPMTGPALHLQTNWSCRALVACPTLSARTKRFRDLLQMQRSNRQNADGETNEKYRRISVLKHGVTLGTAYSIGMEGRASLYW